MTPEISPTFRDDDRRALEAISRKREDLTRARKLSPSLVPALEAEIEACEAALSKARETAVNYERESVEAARAQTLLRAAIVTYNTSHEVEPEAVDRILRDVERAKYLEAAYARRRTAAQTLASSSYARASKEIADRNAAVQHAERLAGAVVDRAHVPDIVANETRPGVIAWLRLALLAEGRDHFVRAAKARENHRNFPDPPPVEDYDDACKAFFAGVERKREQLAQQAAALAGV